MQPVTATTGVEAVVLAGGAGSRFGGDKTAATVGGVSLLGRAVEAAAAAGVSRVVVVGPRLPDDVQPGCELVLTREDPPGSGPVAGLLAGLEHVREDVVVLLAADLPRLPVEALRTLVARLQDDPGLDAVVAEDGDGRAQWLTAAYRVAPLRQAARAAVAGAAARGDGARAPGLRHVVTGLRWSGTPAGSGWGRLVDVDTPEDLSRARLDEWAARLVEELQLHAATDGVEVGDLVDLVLDLARDAAHTVARPAAPLTTFAVGVAAGLAAAGPQGRADLPALRDRVLAMLPADGDG
ncbi:NTP transferase domain-containing protein [Jannaschia sp. R86511]|uniref:NTP transferase domain-containing protein n=1 Tax=Jannaschia sp. R86511 TaxID=3093853 RepID=UPI0036D26AC4